MNPADAQEVPRGSIMELAQATGSRLAPEAHWAHCSPTFMSRTIKITTLVENSVYSGGFKAEHGLAVHLQAGSKSVLFDTGQSNLVMDNAARLKVDLSQLDAIVLSHGHYDHTTGLSEVLKTATRAQLYLHPSAAKPKFFRDPDKSARHIGMKTAATQALKRLQERLVLTADSKEVAPGIFSTGEVPRVSHFEPAESAFFLDDQFGTPDPVLDDQSLFFESAKGLVVILGCAHAGVINTLERVRSLAPNKPFHALLGGMHLLNASPARIEATIAFMRQLDFKLIAPAHCTGALATASFWNAFPGRVSQCATGAVFAFETA